MQSSEPSEHNTELGWKREAEQHAEIRARVDQENEFLRRTLTEQMKFIQRLQDYFTKQPLLNVREHFEILIQVEMLMKIRRCRR